VEGSHLRPYLKAYEADADLLEGRAHLAEGKPAAALPLLQRSHQLHSELYDERSLLTADAKVALAQCFLALGKRDEARALAQQATAIQATHREVGEQLRAPLRTLQQSL
jgi:thioredoxin-like negative regulator of GroEL